MQALAALCEGTEQDMRACLNTLQFLARRCLRVQLADVEGAAIGQKDISRSAFTLWQRLLSGKVGPAVSKVHHPAPGQMAPAQLALDHFA